MSLLKEKYARKIKILRGIEIATCIGKDNYALPDGADVSFFDYCLVEGLDKPQISIAKESVKNALANKFAVTNSVHV